MEQNKNEEEKIIEEFMKSKERMEKFIREELENIKSPLKERLSNAVLCEICA